MQRDIRETPLYRLAQSTYHALREPGTGQISDAVDLCVSPHGKSAVFAGAVLDVLEGLPLTRLCQIDFDTGAMRVLTFGPNTDRLPKYSPDGRRIAFLSDRHQAGDFQLYVLDADSGAARRVCEVEGWVEYLHWSPDGTQILLGVAGHGADVASGQGAIASKQLAQPLPSWMPNIETADASYRWRRAWVYELASGSARAIGRGDTNVWEANWCGNSAIAAVVSPGAEEGLWYDAALQIINVATGEGREVYRPEYQLGWPAASPSGRHLVVVEAICSDRWIVAGDLRLIDTSSGQVRPFDVGGIDVTHTEWRTDRILLVAGHRGFETAVGVVDVAAGTYAQTWSSQELTSGGRYVRVAGIGDTGDCAIVGESFTTAPQIAVIRQGRYSAVKSLDLGYAEQVKAIERVERVTWRASDGLEIQGWLLCPRGSAPYPVVMNVHGGPVWQWRPHWLGRGSLGLPVLMLVKRGYAVFFPNPRGSSGRGQAFARLVLGDMGGADTYDFLSGLDHLVEGGIVDSKRLGVTGGSYGGFMASWLITADSRFAAAVPIAPVTNHVTEHLVSNIPQFVALFLGDTYTNAGGKYFERSPIMHARKVKTPTLHICGALDRCTPAVEAVQFHNALLENGVNSVLAIYPEEGHGVRKLPTLFDYAARMVAWFEEHMPSS